MKLFHEFKAFAVKGNMIDIAIGIVIGASFNKVIDVLVKKVLLPPFTLMSKGIDLGDKKIILRPVELSETCKILVEEVSIGYGSLIESFLDFLIIGITLFVVVKGMNKLREQSEDTNNTKVVTPKNIELLTKIADLLEKQNAGSPDNSRPNK